MDPTDKTPRDSPAYIVKMQHKKLRAKFLKAGFNYLTIDKNYNI